MTETNPTPEESPARPVEPARDPTTAPRQTMPIGDVDDDDTTEYDPGLPMRSAAPAAATEPMPGSAAVPAAAVPVAPAQPPVPAAPAQPPVPPVPVAPVQQPVPPAVADGPVAPTPRSNRLVATAWVLLAAGLFEAIYFALIALIVLLLGGPAAVAPQLALFAATPFAWLPVLFLFLLFELTALLLNRAGGFTYVVASLVVGLLVYIASVLLISILLRGSLGDTSTLAQSFESPTFVLIGVVAREVMLWTGFAIGSRGKRLRLRHRAAQDRYDAEVGQRADAGAPA